MKQVWNSLRAFSIAAALCRSISGVLRSHGNKCIEKTWLRQNMKHVNRTVVESITAKNTVLSPDSVGCFGAGAPRPGSKNFIVSSWKSSMEHHGARCSYWLKMLDSGSTLPTNSYFRFESWGLLFPNESCHIRTTPTSFAHPSHPSFASLFASTVSVWISTLACCSAAHWRTWRTEGLSSKPSTGWTAAQLFAWGLFKQMQKPGSCHIATDGSD